MTVPQEPTDTTITSPNIDRAVATWSVRAPEGPWCRAEWLEHIDAVAPGLRARYAHVEPLEAVCEHKMVGHWALTVASRRGRLHAHRGDHREDAECLLTVGNDWCAAVADGAGSATWSRLGAAIATHVAAHAIHGALAHQATLSGDLRNTLRVVAEAVNAALRLFAELAGIGLRDLRTTLLIVAKTGDQIALMQVGDGAIVLFNHAREATLPTTADAGEFSGEVTHFLPDDGAVERLCASIVVRSINDVVGIIAASDGVEDPWYPFARHGAALYSQLVDGVHDANAEVAGVRHTMRGPVLRGDDPAQALLEWLTFEKRGENDDRTLFVATRV